MARPAEQAAGSIYDLGYRSYEGARLGRRHAITSVYIHSLRGAFGLGRHTSSKIIPFGLAIVALLPAVVQVGVNSLSHEVVDVFRPEDYYEFIQWPLALFAAAVAPELVGRDQRNHTLSLYFSRALLRSDYVLAKVASLATALLILTLVPQTVVFLGESLASDDSAGYLRDNWRDVAPIVASGAMLSLFMASVALAIGSQTSRWPLASGGVIAYFAITFVVASILVQTLHTGPPRYSLLFSGFHVIRGFTLWPFGVTPRLGFDGEDDSLTADLARADLPLYVYALAAAATVAVALFILHRRYRRMAL
jgi:ABC-2 type transport system permease protein